MSGLGQTSKHYLAVHVVRNLASPGAAGIRWELIPRQPAWPYEEAPAFRRFEGSWYLEPFADGTVYVRYFAVAALDPSIPEGLRAWAVKGQLREGGARRGARARSGGGTESLGRRCRPTGSPPKVPTECVSFATTGLWCRRRPESNARRAPVRRWPRSAARRPASTWPRALPATASTRRAGGRSRASARAPGGRSVRGSSPARRS
jgi:hypothetical protein